MSDVINVEKRDETGTLRMRRMRQAGRIPGIVYGHGQECVSISIDSRDVERMVNAGKYVVELGGAVKESALVKEVQWDGFGTSVMHVDFARVDATEIVEVNLSVELRGVAPGTKNGGILKQGLHEISISCPALKVPDTLSVSVNELKLDQSITAGEIALPDSAELLTDPSAVVVSCPPASVAVEVPEDGDGDAAEPEVIGRKADDEGEAEG